MLRYKYIERPERARKGAGIGKWRWKYFVDTRLGYWTSGECYLSNKGSFMAQGADERAADIADLKAYDVDRWYPLISKKLFVANRRLQDAELDPEQYFWLGPIQGTPEKPERYIDGNKYHPDLAKQVKKDKRRLANEAFTDRFISGYEFFPVPDLRGSEAESERFLLSLCEGVLDGWNAGKQRTNVFIEVLAKRLRECGERADRMDAPRLLDAVRVHWRGIAASVRAFHVARIGE